MYDFLDSFASPRKPKIIIILIMFFAVFFTLTKDTTLWRTSYDNNLPVIHIGSPIKSSYASISTIEYQVNITDRDGANDINQVKISWCSYNGTELAILYDGPQANNTGSFYAPNTTTGLNRYRFRVEAWDFWNKVSSERVIFVGKNSDPTLYAWIYPPAATELVNDTLSVKIEYNASDIDGNLQAVDIIILYPMDQSSVLGSDISSNYNPVGVYSLVGKEFFTITGTREGLNKYTIRITARDLDNREVARFLSINVEWVNTTEPNNTQSSGLKQVKDYTRSPVPSINLGEIVLVFLFYGFIKKSVKKERND